MRWMLLALVMTGCGGLGVGAATLPDGVYAVDMVPAPNACGDPLDHEWSTEVTIGGDCSMIKGLLSCRGWSMAGQLVGDIIDGTLTWGHCVTPARLTITAPAN